MPEKKGAKSKKSLAGESVNALPSGAFVFPNGDRYDGEYVTNNGVLERSGNGTHTTSDGLVYRGQWREDKMNGEGCITFPSGCSYEGTFQDNRFHGKGRYVWANGSHYEGDFADNKLLGAGEFADTEGQIWCGDFQGTLAIGLRFKLNL